MLTFTELWEKLLSQDETAEIEAKRAFDIGKSILETVSAFANEPGRGGGYLVLGVESSEDNALNEYKIIRFSNRLEIRNSGHSLKPVDSLGEPGSITRNDKIAAVLHEIGIAETKGSGIRVMFDEMREANLTVPLFESSKEKNSFTAKLLVHHLLGSADIEWLAQFKHYSLSNDEARALIVLREIGEINNFIYRLINCIDPLTASQHLRRYSLLEPLSVGGMR